MTISNTIKEKISIEVIKTLVTRFENFPEDASNNRNAPFHESFLRAFADKFNGRVTDTPLLISLSSWLHGLNTTLGQIFFENVAHYLCNGEKREYTSKKLGNLKISQTQKDNISNYITNLSNGAVIPDLNTENQLIFQNYNTQLVNALDFSADVFFEDANSITAIELKSVKPNSGEMRGEKEKILEGKATLFQLFPDKEINFFIGFPFDPTVNPSVEKVTSFNKARFLGSIININKYFAPCETLVANELWNFLSDAQNTMEQILEIINTISTTSFYEKFNFLNDNTQRNTSNYAELLNLWNLFSELELVHNNNVILQNIQTDKKLTRDFNNKIFNNKGCYNWDRFNKLRYFL